MYGGGNGADEPIFTSTNSGLTWISNNIIPWINITSVASSADGKILVGVGYNSDSVPPSPITYALTNSGLAWTLYSPGSAIMTSIASSADGSRLVAAANFENLGGYCYYSTNLGANWSFINSLPFSYWNSIACSADGTKLCAVINRDNPTVYVSTNSGLSWTNVIVGGQPGAVVAVSADGSKFMLLTEYEFNASTNSGDTWMHYPNSLYARFCPLASSADGNKLVTGVSGVIYTSTNGGANWFSNSAPNTTWNSVASSADGSELFAVSSNGIYTLQVAPMPQLNINPSSGNLALSWIVPSTNFVLQQNLDLTTTNWTYVTDTPTLNLSSLQYQVSILPTNSSAFYRLATP